MHAGNLVKLCRGGRESEIVSEGVREKVRKERGAGRRKEGEEREKVRKENRGVGGGEAWMHVTCTAFKERVQTMQFTTLPKPVAKMAMQSMDHMHRQSLCAAWPPRSAPA